MEIVKKLTHDKKLVDANEILEKMKEKMGTKVDMANCHI
jgi:hypothetical protein